MTAAMERSGPPGPPGALELANALRANSPVCRIPEEVLVEILFLSVGTDECSPRRLAQVCRRWYLVAINTPYLWNHIDVMSSSEYSKTGRYTDRSAPERETCTSLAELKQTLSRAGSTLLTIRMEFEAYGDLGEHGFGIPSTAGLLRLLFSRKVSARIEDLDLDAWGLQVPEGTINWGQSKFTSLRKLTCGGDFPDADWFLKVVEKTAEKLDHIYFAYSSPGITLKCLWPRLKRLSYPCNTDISVDLVIPYCRGLEYLEFEGGNWPTDKTPRTVFANMSYMSLRCSNLVYMTKVQLPRLTTLHLRHWTNDDEDNPALLIPIVSNTTIDLPELRCLQVSTSFAWVVAFRTPKLSELTISSSTSNPDWEDQVISFLILKATSTSLPSFKHVEALSLTTGASDSSIVSLLRIFSKVSKLRLSSYCWGSSEEFGQHLIRKLASTAPDEEGLLPNLKSLEWGENFPRLKVSKNDVALVVKDILEDRKKEGLPLEKVTVFIKTGEKLEDREDCVFT